MYSLFTFHFWLNILNLIKKVNFCHTPLVTKKYGGSCPPLLSDCVVVGEIEIAIVLIRVFCQNSLGLQWLWVMTQRSIGRHRLLLRRCWI